MAADDQQEKSLFVRIKNCVLTELNRKQDDLPRARCSSRSIWGWSVGRDSVDDESQRTEQRLKEDDKSAAEKKAAVEGLKKSDVSSVESGTKEAEEKSSKIDGVQSENRSDGIDRENKEERATDQNLSRPDKFKPRRYYIKMQNPEAPPCCEAFKSSNEDNEKHRAKPVCRCNESAGYRQ